MTGGPTPPDHLAVYGTLRPGEENHWVLRNIAGVWSEGTVKGWTYPIGFGPAAGYPGFSTDPNGQDVAVAVLTSENLEKHWRDIDEFEGPGYRRVTVDVTLADGDIVTGWIYETDPDVD